MKTKIITYGTSGYLEFMKNFYCNLSCLGLSGNLKIFCLDKNCYDEMKDFADCDVISWQVDEVKTDMIEYGAAGYDLIMRAKLEIITKELETSERILYSDSDMFFINDPMNYLDSSMRRKDLDALFMLDWNGEACAGFFYINNSEACKELFKPERVSGQSAFDQTLINKRLQTVGVKHSTLPPSCFPNGLIWRGGVSDWGGIAKFAVHYNATSPFNKKELMQRYGHWVI